MSKMPKQVTMYRDEKSGRFVKGKPEEIDSDVYRKCPTCREKEKQKKGFDECLNDQSKRLEISQYDDLVGTKIKEYLQENAELVDDKPKTEETQIRFSAFINVTGVILFIEIAAFLFVAILYLGERI